MTWRLWQWKLPAKIRRRIKIDPATGCWLWTGGVNAPWVTRGWGGGYGYIRHDGRMQRVHRIVYALLVGDPGPLLMHLCGVRRCCNPNHLEPGSDSANQLERWERHHEQAHQSAAAAA